MFVNSVGTAFPPHYYDQDVLIRALRELWGDKLQNPARIDQLHKNTLVGGRHLALPLGSYRELKSFADANRAFIACAVDLGEQALRAGLALAGLRPDELDHIFFVSVTGIATPSIDARLVNRLGLRSDIKRTPIFGLGCVAGAAGVARVSDYLAAFPRQAAALVSVELCSLTLQRGDLSIPNLISSGLFGDGAAAVIMTGAERPCAGPRVVATRSAFYPHTEEVMGWDVTDSGFRVVLSADVPNVVRTRLGADVDHFLADHELSRADIQSYVCHPGGPKVLEAFAEALAVDRDALAVTWDSLARVGNLSSASVLMVLDDTMRDHRPPKDSFGLMIAMGPGFCAELVLLRW